jgi:16S rRNA C967 or C1407 C5-methylase (RsmB/RsmF family)
VAAWFDETFSEDWEPFPFPQVSEVTSSPMDSEGLALNLSKEAIARSRHKITLNCPSMMDRAHWKRLWPHIHGTDGFFIARWKRKTNLSLRN